MAAKDKNKEVQNLSLSHRVNFTLICDKYSSLASEHIYKKNNKLQEIATQCKIKTQNIFRNSGKSKNEHTQTHNRNGLLNNLEVCNYLHSIDKEIDDRITNYSFDSGEDSVPVNSLHYNSMCDKSVKSVNRKNIPVGMKRKKRDRKLNKNKIKSYQKLQHSNIIANVSHQHDSNIITRSRAKAGKFNNEQIDSSVKSHCSSHGQLHTAQSFTMINKDSNTNTILDFSNIEESDDDLITILPSYQYEKGNKADSLTKQLNGYLVLGEDLSVRYVDNMTPLNEIGVSILYAKKDYSFLNDGTRHAINFIDNLKDNTTCIDMGSVEPTQKDKNSTVESTINVLDVEVSELNVHNSLDPISPIKFSNSKRSLRSGIKRLSNNMTNENESAKHISLTTVSTIQNDQFIVYKNNIRKAIPSTNTNCPTESIIKSKHINSSNTRIIDPHENLREIRNGTEGTSMPISSLHSLLFEKQHTNTLSSEPYLTNINVSNDGSINPSMKLTDNKNQIITRTFNKSKSIKISTQSEIQEHTEALSNESHISSPNISTWQNDSHISSSNISTWQNDSHISSPNISTWQNDSHRALLLNRIQPLQNIGNEETCTNEELVNKLQKASSTPLSCRKNIPATSLNMCYSKSNISATDPYKHISVSCFYCSNIYKDHQICKYNKNIITEDEQMNLTKERLYKENNHLHKVIKWKKQKHTSLGSLKMIRVLKHKFSMINSTSNCMESEESIEKITTFNEDTKLMLMEKCDLSKRKTFKENCNISKLECLKPPKKSIVCTKLIDVLNQTSLNKSMVSKSNRDFTKNFNLLFN